MSNSIEIQHDYTGNADLGGHKPSHLNRITLGLDTYPSLIVVTGSKGHLLTAHADEFFRGVATLRAEYEMYLTYGIPGPISR